MARRKNADDDPDTEWGDMRDDAVNAKNPPETPVPGASGTGMPPRPAKRKRRRNEDPPLPPGAR